jgi:ferritin-like metal-binding protein YciE
MRMETVEDVFKNELFDIYNAEKQLLKALKEMSETAEHEDLATAFSEHRAQTEGHVERIERVCEILDVEIDREKCEAMEGILEEGKEMMKKIDKGPVLDAAMITAAQKVEHYEIASYGSLCALAKGLGYEEIAEILHQTLDEEKETDSKLTMLAEANINQDALTRAA